MNRHDPLLSHDDQPLVLGGLAPRPKRKRSFALAWGLVLAAMTLVATSSWVFSLYVFGHPEEPKPHALLVKLGRLDPPKRFSAFDVPDGRPLGARDAYSKYRRFASLPEQEMGTLNRRLLREYITNYRHADPIDYLNGSFRVVSVQAFGASAFMPAGVVLRAQSTEMEELEIDYLLPGPDVKPDPFRPGDDLEVQATTAYGAVIRFQPLGGEKILLTVVPLVYGDHPTPSGGRLRLSPPARLNVSAPWPATRPEPPPSP